MTYQTLSQSTSTVNSFAHSFEQKSFPALAQMPLYLLFSRFPGPQRFSTRIYIIAFVCTHIPLFALVLYLFSQSTWEQQDWFVLGIVLLATLIGTAINLAALHAYGEPIQAVIQSLKNYTTRQQLPHLPTTYKDELGCLLSNVQSTLTTLDQAMTEVQELSIRDELTGLYNRRFFNTQAPKILRQTQQYNQPLSVMLSDIDHFKQINDRFSHLVGDQVLRQVAQLLMKETRSSDLVARFGGEEFIAVFPAANPEQAAQLCDRLRLCIQSYNWSSIHPDLQVTISMGISSEAHSNDLEKIISMADEKLYQAKRNGRNQVRW